MDLGGPVWYSGLEPRQLSFERRQPLFMGMLDGAARILTIYVQLQSAWGEGEVCSSGRLNEAEHQKYNNTRKGCGNRH